MTGPVPPRLAATVAILRDGPAGPEVLLTRRPPTMAFGPGLHVFPGGAVDAADADPMILARLRPPLAGDPAGLHGPAFVVAAIREAWEEAGVLLASGPGAVGFPAASVGRPFAALTADRDLELRGDWLVPHARWVTPAALGRRFDARFFAAWLPDGAEPAFDDGEVDGHEWVRPADALEALADGRIDLWMPTATTLQHLAGVGGPADLAAIAPPGSVPASVAERPSQDGHGLLRVVATGTAGGVPGRRGRSWLVGRRRLVVVDAGDPSEEALAAILAEASTRGAAIAAVVLTAADPDRAAGAEHLALALGVPVLAPPAASRVLACATRPIVVGETIAAGDVPLRAVRPASGRADAVAYEVGETGLRIEGGEDGKG
ncbi:MAG TPA: NUDIX domain-containing protein [Candidatus Limnocylindrales bacterium]|nr:NUDIX domain-containing protein [Candidatus Limnocylindrales bacterium]